jgi:1-aminocyclopropane-1-carboxylate deaminase/D-cysteine desulfhydrase-like pyridoxal-dependent ACC family enzyme
LRLDLLHPVISGNKWFKLKFYLDEARRQNKTLLTFGGAYSNHIAATAAAAKKSVLVPSVLFAAKKLRHHPTRCFLQKHKA